MKIIYLGICLFLFNILPLAILAAEPEADSVRQNIVWITESEMPTNFNTQIQ